MMSFINNNVREVFSRPLIKTTDNCLYGGYLDGTIPSLFYSRLDDAMSNSILKTEGFVNLLNKFRAMCQYKNTTYYAIILPQTSYIFDD